MGCLDCEEQALHAAVGAVVGVPRGKEKLIGFHLMQGHHRVLVYRRQITVVVKHQEH